MEVYQDLRRVACTDELARRALRFYRQIGKHFRKTDNYKAALFFCLWCAHKQLRVVIDPLDLAAQVGIQPKMVSESLKVFSQHRTGIVIPEYTFTELDFIDYYNTTLQFSPEVIAHLKRLAQRLLKHHPSLMMTAPQIIAGAVFVFHSRETGMKLKSRIMDLIHKKSSVLIYKINKLLAEL